MSSTKILFYVTWDDINASELKSNPNLDFVGRRFYRDEVRLAEKIEPEVRLFQSEVATHEF